MIAAVQPAPSAPRDLLLCFSHLRWNFVLQRPQHLMTRAAERFHVVFVEEPLFEEAETPDLRVQWQDRVMVATPVLPHGQDEPERIIRDLIERLVSVFDSGRTVLWYYTPMALPLAASIPADCIVFDCMDELSAFRHAPPRLLEFEAALLGLSDLVFTGGVSLYEAKRDRHDSVHCFPSSIDMAHFAKARARTGPDPADQNFIPHPRIGFFGVIDERLDIALLAALAERRPHWHFVMLGPVVKIDPETLPKALNIHWLGRKDYAELPAYLGGWDAGFMPFAHNESTRFISPTKTPEFLAAGLQVVSTPVRDVVSGYGDAGLVGIADGPDEMGAALATLLRVRGAGWPEAIDRQLGRSSWDTTWAEMQTLIETVLARSAAPAISLHRSERSAHV